MLSVGCLVATYTALYFREIIAFFRAAPSWYQNVSWSANLIDGMINVLRVSESFLLILSNAVVVLFMLGWLVDDECRWGRLVRATIASHCAIKSIKNPWLGMNVPSPRLGRRGLASQGQQHAHQVTSALDIFRATSSEAHVRSDHMPRVFDEVQEQVKLGCGQIESDVVEHHFTLDVDREITRS